jgi:predicted MFS family arabinose efflux permease
MVLPMALALAGMLFVGASAARSGERRLHGAVPMFIAALGLAVGAWTQSPVLGLVCVCLAGIGVYAAFGVWWSYPTSFLSGAAAAGAVGLINSFGNIGGYVGPYITGWVKDHTGSFQWACVVLAGSLLAAGLLMLTLRRTDAAPGPAVSGSAS